MLFPSPSWPLIIEEITAARAAVKFGSAVSAVIVSATAFCCENADDGEPPENCSPENLDWLYNAWPITCGNIPEDKFVICCCCCCCWCCCCDRCCIKELWIWLVAAGVEEEELEPLGGCGEWVRSNVTVGNGAEAEIVAILVEQGRTALANRLVGFIIPSWLDIDPDNNMFAAAVVVEAIATAAGGNGWLWFPS